MVGGEGMSEGMAGKAMLPPQLLFVGGDKIGNPLMVDGFRGIPFLGEEPVPGTSILWKGVPVLENQLPCLFRKLGIPGRPVFGGTDENPGLGMFNIGTFQMTHFPDAQPGGEHQAEEGFKLDVRNGRQEKLHLLSGRDKGKIRVKFSEWELISIPRLMQDI